MDGRVQLPVINWINENCGPCYVDMITEPGMDGLLAEKPQEELSDILRKIDVSIRVHFTKEIVIAAHYDCIGNPVDQTTHKQHVLKAVERLKDLKPDMKIAGLWVNENGIVEKIAGK